MAAECWQCFHWRMTDVAVIAGTSFTEVEIYACALGNMTEPHDFACASYFEHDDLDLIGPQYDDSDSSLIRDFMFIFGAYSHDLEF